MLIQKLLFPLLVLFAFAACEDDDDVTLDPTKDSGAPVAVYKDSSEGRTVVQGAYSGLCRTEDGITAHFRTEDLIPGNAYTLWFVVFDDEPGPPSSTYASGYVAGESGEATFAGHLRVGDGFDAPGTLTTFNTPLTAEVHLALRTHGPVQPGKIQIQTQTMDGGCTSGFPSGPLLHPDSDEVGYCANVQVAIHPAQ
ncbi:hypothetical protein LEM8419_01973 [Neolewinella maritima]|uniref:DUF3455 domain-containing protein n=1 Tax=Neolewinella maritima TaxID=1383882 RepID=A0ABN8F986_9BACT|nr:hypothetical protein [Neolewinella maritima]CAH1000964.1 hypothetical protein LEM8419_01973 [Neolewinella maritima]